MKAFEYAKPVWVNDFETVNQYAEFLTVLRLSGSRTVIRIAADSHYALYVNDTYVYAYQYADDERLRVYDEIDISEYVHPGENSLRILGYCALTDSSVYKKGKPYLIFEVREEEKVVCFSGKDTLARIERRYKNGKTDLITGQLGYTISYNSTIPQDEYEPAVETGDSYEFIPRPVKMCRMLERVPARLISQGMFMEKKGAQTIGARMQNAYLSYAERRTLGETGEYAPVFPDENGKAYRSEDENGLYFLFDLGHNDVGFMDLEFSVPEACEVLIGWGEHLDDLRVRSWVGGRNFAAGYTAHAGKNHFFHPLRRIGARYLQVHAYGKEILIHYAGMRPVEYPVPEGAQMLLSDPMHQRIYDTCRRTLLMCMHEHYEDCPWREQALYAMDSRNQMLAGYYVFGEYEFAKASIGLLARSLRPDGLLELCAPARVSVDIPSFSMMFVVALWEYLLYSGDEAFVKEMLPTAETIVNTALQRVGENNLVKRYAGDGMWNFYEWTENLDGHLGLGPDQDENRFDAPLSAFLILAVDRLSKIHAHFGSTEAASHFERRAQDMRFAAHAEFFESETQEYFSYSFEGKRWAKDELTQALMVYSGVCPENMEEKALQRLVSGSMTPVTLSYAVFKYEALLQHPEKFADWVRRDIEKQWGGMLMRGATSFYETILAGDDFSRAGSLCHGWSAVPAYLYFAYGAGAAPETAGWAKSMKKRVSGMPAIEKAVIRKADGTTETMV